MDDSKIDATIAFIKTSVEAFIKTSVEAANDIRVQMKLEGNTVASSAKVNEYIPQNLPEETPSAQSESKKSLKPIVQQSRFAHIFDEKPSSAQKNEETDSVRASTISTQPTQSLHTYTAQVSQSSESTSPQQHLTSSPTQHFQRPPLADSAIYSKNKDSPDLQRIMAMLARSTLSPTSLDGNPSPPKPMPAHMNPLASGMRPPPGLYTRPPPGLTLTKPPSAPTGPPPPGLKTPGIMAGSRTELK